MPYDPTSGRTTALERGDGAAELAFAGRGPGNGLRHLYQHDPCRVLFPRAEPGHPPTAVLLTTSGGLTGGDRLRLSFAAREGAAATITSQAAEKIYRALDGECRIDIAIDVGNAWLEWLPQETILFDGARLARRTTLAATAESRLLASEMLVFGRTARGESYTSGFLHDSWRITRDGRLVWVDALTLEGDIAAALARPAAFDGARAVATAVYVATDAAAHLDTARALLEPAESWAAATVVNEILLARFVGRDAASVRRDLIGYLCGLRRAAGGWPARLPRVWYH
ncbi:MAG TPA: urease accessory protein UreD [Alphaproteobacteria bacterium]|nr:urease accessory protein UreD [Alphaproteobacteria bacterium]